MAEITSLVLSTLVLAAILVKGGCGEQTESTQLERPPSAPEVRRSLLRSGGSSWVQLLNNRYVRRPRKKHLEPEYLRGLLGDDFDSDWMSEERPAENKVTIQKWGWSHSSLKEQLKGINLTAELEETGGADAILQDPFALAAIEKWLLRRASCPVRFVWDEVTDLFWPRWIKRGECGGNQGACSWPPGMHCVPSETLHLHVLRWQCRLAGYRNRGRRRREWRKVSSRTQPGRGDLKCQWIRVPYPVTSGCFCTC